MAKNVTSKSYKIPSSKGRDLRIKKCTVEGCKGKPETKEFIAEPFKGICCTNCLEVISYELLETPKPDVENNSNKGRMGDNTGGTFGNDEIGPDGWPNNLIII